MNMLNTIKNFLHSRLNAMRFSAQVLVMGIILSLTLFLLAIDMFKVYRSEISILVNVKSELAQMQSERIMANIIEIPQTLSFYDRLLKLNPDVRDVTVGLDSNERKEKWNEMFSIEQVKENASIFKISMIAKHENDSQQLASKTARTLFDTVAFYYDIKKDVDLRIVEGPISSSEVPSWLGLFLLSVIGGFALSVILNFFFIIGRNSLIDGGDLLKKSSFFDFKKKSDVTAEEEIKSLNTLYQSEQFEAPFVFEDKEMESILPTENLEKNPQEDPKFQEIKKITKKFEPGKYPNFPEMPIREKQPEIVPHNLPIADDSFLVQHEKPQHEMPAEQPAVAVEQEPVADVKKEPTPEELKKRLNQLLRGEL